MFNKGQKVVCCDDTFPKGIEQFYDALPVKNSTYTVRDVVPGRTWESGEATEVAVYLEELINPVGPPPAHAERGFNVERFAPLQELTTSEEEVYRDTAPIERELVEAFEFKKQMARLRHDLIQEAVNLAQSNDRARDPELTVAKAMKRYEQYFGGFI